MEEFRRGKRELGTSPNDKYAVHSTLRFIDGKGVLFETAITYTDRLVHRSGVLGPDGISITWTDWQTEHDVVIPDNKDQG